LSKLKYAVKNGDNILGTMWESKDNKEVFVLMSDWDVSHPLEIRDSDGNDVDDVDSIDLLTSILPR